MPHLFDALDATVPPELTTLAVAVSGGADSMALTLCLKEWCQSRHITLYALHVDHGLRPESGQEAVQVVAWLKSHGVACEVFTLDQLVYASGNRQQEARRQRYSVMAKWCDAHHICYLTTAHHMGDQAETVLMRLARGSGIDGLRGMETYNRVSGIMLWRPWLSVTREQIEAYLTEQQQPWIDEASNHSNAYTRNRIRSLMPALATQGLTQQRLSQTASHMQRASHCLQQISLDWIHTQNALQHSVFACIPIKAFQTLHDELALRVMRLLLCYVAGNTHTPRFVSIQPLVADVKTCHSFRSMTLHGCWVGVYQGNLYIGREPARISCNTFTKHHAVIWDKRIKVTVQTIDECAKIQPLSVKGLKQLRDRQVVLPAWPAAILHGLPALYCLDEVATVPHIDYMTQSCENWEYSMEYIPKLPDNASNDLNHGATFL